MKKKEKDLSSAELPLKSDHRKFLKQKGSDRRRNFGTSGKKEEQKVYKCG